jgi:L-alanine-DL-glutamate epimerase-like enolase superfamily enzyme
MRDSGFPTKVHRIASVACFAVSGKRHKRIGCNAILGEHGQEGSERILRIRTDTGLTGLGTVLGGEDSIQACRKAAEAILGKDLFDFYQPGAGLREMFPFHQDGWPRRMFDIAFWDLWSQAQSVPVWKLLGGTAQRPIPVYDTSLYFTDLLHPEEGLGAVRREVEESLRSGFQMIKAKVGRGKRWMERHAGDRQDVQVVRAIRETAGNIILWLDANNGYSLEGAMRFVREVKPYRPALVEEMFREAPRDSRDFRSFVSKEAGGLLIGDGENFRHVEQVAPYIEHRLFDVIQLDMRMMGLTEYLKLARLAEDYGLRIAPHNWGSQFGAYVIVHLGTAVPNLAAVEMDCLLVDALNVEPYEFREGHLYAPDLPGLGMYLNEDRLNRKNLVFDVSQREGL